MTFSVELDNIKVVDNLSIFAVLKSHDFILSGLGAMNFQSSRSGLDCMLYSPEVWCFSTMLTSKIAFVDN